MTIMYDIVVINKPTVQWSTNMSIKKQYQAIYALLEENSNKKVSTIMPKIVELMSAKVTQKTFMKNEDGIVTHVYCYYHKKWEDVTQAEYGKKANTATGLNTMCKEGVSAWNKQQRRKTKANAELLEFLASGELSPDEIASKQAEILLEVSIIEPRSDEHGSDELN